MGNGAATSIEPSNRFSGDDGVPSIFGGASTSMKALFGPNRSEDSTKCASEDDSPKLTEEMINICDWSWKKIVLNSARDSRGVIRSGITLFQSEFFDRLKLLDSDGFVEKKFESCSLGKNKTNTKGSLLITIVRYITSISLRRSDVTKLRALGRAHARRHIGEHQLNIFRETLVKTIASRLDSAASYEVMESWSILLNYTCDQMVFDRVIFKSHITLDVQINSGSSSNKEKDSVVEGLDAGRLLEDEVKSENGEPGLRPGAIRPTHLDANVFSELVVEDLDSSI